MPRRHNREFREGLRAQAGSGPAAVTGTKANVATESTDSGRLVSRMNREPEDLPEDGPAFASARTVSRGGIEDEVNQGAVLGAIFVPGIFV